MRSRSTDSRCDTMDMSKIKEKFKNGFRLPRIGKKKKDEVEVLEAYPPEGITDKPKVTEEAESEQTETEEPKQKMSIFRKIHVMIWGSGKPGRYNTPETPYPPYCLRARFRRWWYVKYRGWVYYITTMYDRPNDEYIYDMEFVPRTEIPRTATKVTNEKGTFHNDLDHPNRDFIVYDNDFGFTAHDADLYIKCNKIDEAMKIELDGKPQIDTMKVIGIVAGVAIAFIVFYMMFMQR